MNPFNPKPEIIKHTHKDWEEMTKDTFNIIFKNSAIKRTRFEGLKEIFLF